MADTLDPDENDAVFSLPQQYYISTFSGWKDRALRSGILETMRASYKEADLVSGGMYIADFDPSLSSVQSSEVCFALAQKLQ